MFPRIKIWGAATVGTKGQVVIPAEAREALNIKEGDKLIVVGNPERRGVAFVKSEVVEDKLQDMQNGLLQVQALTKIEKKGRQKQ
jgi:AbrB family looped-hinge helix DNA binding protein